MQAKLITYGHASNGVSLFVVPETDAERELLRGLWRHGKLQTCNGVADRSGQGFCVTWKFREDQCEST